MIDGDLSCQWFRRLAESFGSIQENEYIPCVSALKDADRNDIAGVREFRENWLAFFEYVRILSCGSSKDSSTG
jgi:hypothetical protein